MEFLSEYPIASSKVKKQRVIKHNLFDRIKNVDEKVLSRLFFDLKIKIKTEILIKQKEDLKKQQDQFQTELELNELMAKIGQIEKELQVLKKLKHK